MLKLYILYSEKLDYHIIMLDNERKKNPVWYHKWNFAGLFLIPFYLNIIDRAMIEMFPCDNHFLFPLFLHGYDFPWEKL